MANVKSFRISLSLLGDGFIEAIADQTLLDIAASQVKQTNGEVHGDVIFADVAEAPGASRAARFGWKNQHASLLSFSGDAYRNEMGITNPLVPTENSSNGNSVSAFDTVSEPEDDGRDLKAFTEFMRATKAPARDSVIAKSIDAQNGEKLFSKVGCDVCHVPSITTAPPGTPINGGTFVVPVALGNKIIYPYSDFLMHDVGTGDGIVQNGDQKTRNRLRTPPLWGIRTQSRMLHDSSAVTIADAIMAHKGEANSAVAKFNQLPHDFQLQMLTFLNSL